MNQEERLDTLVNAFIKDAAFEIEEPETKREKQILLRSLMNIRMPKKMDEKIIKIQDDYLKEKNEEKGIVNGEDIPAVKSNPSIAIWQGDITRLQVDAIVNAANNQMLGCFQPMHTCIDNCIHTYAGVELRAECKRQMNQLKAQFGQDYVQPTAVPMVTKGYNLPAKNIIHIVGPIVYGSVTRRNQEDLRNCYIHILETCKKEGFQTVAICCLSTGVFHFPNKLAAKIAIETVEDWLKKNPNVVERVIFNVFKEEDKRYYEEFLA